MSIEVLRQDFLERLQKINEEFAITVTWEKIRGDSVLRLAVFLIASGRIVSGDPLDVLRKLSLCAMGLGTVEMHHFLLTAAAHATLLAS